MWQFCEVLQIWCRALYLRYNECPSLLTAWISDTAERDLIVGLFNHCLSQFQSWSIKCFIVKNMDVPWVVTRHSSRLIDYVFVLWLCIMTFTHMETWLPVKGCRVSASARRRGVTIGQKHIAIYCNKWQLYHNTYCNILPRDIITEKRPNKHRNS
jgi:hypothetical protein